MTTIKERRQRLAFDSTWTVVKWDESPEFVGSMDQALHQLPGDGVKAADVVGVQVRPRRARTVLIAEFKDFAHPNVPPDQLASNAQRATSDELQRDLIRKVIDTLTGATFAHDDTSSRRHELDEWRPSIGYRPTQILVLLCIETPPSQSIAVLAWTKRLQQRLRWLGPHAQVFVTSSARPFTGAGVAYSVV